MDSNALIPLHYALDTFYLLICGALVMWMAAGFAMLESGLVRSKNTTEILTKNVILYGVACVMYLLVGYHIMYSSPEGGILPSLGFLIGAEHAADVVAAGGDDAPAFSKRADFFFQVVFVATAMSIVSGAVAERMKLLAFLAFAVVMTGFIYPVQGYWKWGSGFLNQAGFLDFAGSGVVHLCGATAALAGVLMLGARRGKYASNGQVNAIPGANLPLATLGALILWFGWFGFNGGSQLKISSIADANAVASAFLNTNMAAAGGRRSAGGAGRRAPAVRQGRPDHGPQWCPGRAGGDHRRAGHPGGVDRGADRRRGRRAGGGWRAAAGQAEDRRPGGRHRGAWPGRHLGPARRAADQ
ncbi:Ammonia channel precursor [compost metagenome]